LVRALACALGLVFASESAVEAAGKTHVDASVMPQGIAVTTRAQIDATQAVIWQTLTDYDHLAQFIPGMTTSRTVTRCGNTAVVAQTGDAGSGLFSYPIDIVVQADEHPSTDITVRLLSGNLRTYQGGYHLEPVAGATDSFILTWSGIIEPDIALPGFITGWALRQAVEGEFRAMLAEIERRQALYSDGRLIIAAAAVAPCSSVAPQASRG
jgi:Polyketide cyclase / dehydrase and lipid transport.